MISEDILKKYQMTIGIECHVQLSTKTKLFSGADNDERDKSPNSVVSPIDWALPGMLPVLNRSAIDFSIHIAKALNAKVANISRFDRKHYFYPDLPKGYQTTQMYQPIIGPGVVNIPMEDGTSFAVRINHAHLEEDAGKLTHFGNYSLVDLNRAGTPLVEIVTEPDIHSAVQAKAFAIELYNLMTFAGVTRGDLYHGNMRFDVNISVAPAGSSKLGKRAEVKNLNSFRSVERAVEYEFSRQVELLEKGDSVVQETRGWDDTKQRTISQRSKENAQDYRYMPDADIPPIIISDDEIAEVQVSTPKLPPEYRSDWLKNGFDNTTIDALMLSKESAKLIDSILIKSSASIAKRIGFWFLKNVNGERYLDKLVAKNSQLISEDKLIKLSQMVEDGLLNSNAGDTIFLEMSNTGEDPDEIAVKLNLIQNNDEDEISKIVDEVLTDKTSAQAVTDLKAGNEKVIGFLVGQVMRKSAGKANPSLVQKLIHQKVKGD